MMGTNTKPPEPTYDPKCYDLAVHFLEDDECMCIDTKRNRAELAAEIQNTIENFVEREKNNLEPRETGDAWTGGFAENH